ncbi:MAG: hypothetical protein RL095_1388 [Verrucomicrobiota bacterium]|jgi:glutathione synthase/RimK-type ligase-like ATP-grasp enzyme
MTLQLLNSPALLSAAPDDPWSQQVILEDAWLLQALKRAGLAGRRVAWQEAAAGPALMRSAWDCYQHLDDFRRLLESPPEDLRLFNPPQLQLWNLDKAYLLELGSKGVPCIPSILLRRPADFTEIPADEAVLKPACGGGGVNCFRLKRGQPMPAGWERAFDPEFGALLQPFLPAVLGQGEVSLIAIAGAVTHGLRKTPRPGEFRCQDDHGGSVHFHRPAADEIAVALAALAACPVQPLYARIDLLRDSQGQPCLVELELIEPELFLRCHPPAATALAHALLEALKS